MRHRRIAGVLVLAVVLVAALEITSRIDDWIRYGVPPWSRVTSEDDLVVRDAFGQHGRADVAFKNWTMNSVGMRGPNVTRAKEAGTLRVVTAGASETFGLRESPGQEFPRQLEDSLEHWFRTHTCGPERLQRAEVLNAALLGMSLPTVDQDLRLRVSLLKPDVVVLYPTPVQYLWVDLPAASTPDTSGRDERLPERRVFVLRSMLRLYDALRASEPRWLSDWLQRQHIVREVRAHPPGWKYASLPEPRLAAYDSAVRRTIGTIRRIGAAPVIVTHANAMAGAPRDPVLLLHWERMYPRATGNLLVDFDSAASLVTARAARDSAVTLVDLMAEFRARRHGPAAFADYAHFTDAGASFVAGRLLPAVLDATHLSAAACPAGASSPIPPAARSR